MLQTDQCLLLFPCRLVCVVPSAVAAPPQLYAANPPVAYSLDQKSFQRQLQEASAPLGADIHHFTSRSLLHFPDLQLMQMDSGKPFNHYTFYFHVNYQAVTAKQKSNTRPWVQYNPLSDGSEAVEIVKSKSIGSKPKS